MSAPFSIRKRPARIALLASIPHASAFIPQSARDTFVLDDDALEQELLKVTDRYVDELFSCVTGLGGITVTYNCSRLVVDPERFEDDEKEIMAAKGQGVIYVRTSDGSKLREHVPTDKEREELLDHFYRPYHGVLEDETERLLDSFGTCLILDCHSFPSAPLPCELNQDPNRPDICLGTDPFHTPAELVQAVEAFFRERGLTTARNMPFEGTYVPLKFLGTDSRVSSLMIEVNRKLYMDEATGGKLESFQDIGDTTAAFVRLVGQELPFAGDRQHGT